MTPDFSGAVDVVLFLITGVVSFYLYMTKKSQVNTDRLDVLEKGIQGKLTELSERVAKVEGSRPTLEKLGRDVGKVHARIDETNTILSRLEGEYRASKGTLDLLHQFLLNNGKGQQ